MPVPQTFPKLFPQVMLGLIALYLCIHTENTDAILQLLAR